MLACTGPLPEHFNMRLWWIPSLYARSATVDVCLSRRVDFPCATHSQHARNTDQRSTSRRARVSRSRAAMQPSRMCASVPPVHTSVIAPQDRECELAFELASLSIEHGHAARELEPTTPLPELQFKCSSVGCPYDTAVTSNRQRQHVYTSKDELDRVLSWYQPVSDARERHQARMNDSCAS